MADNIDQSPNSGTNISLRDYVDLRFASSEERVRSTLESTKEAISKAEAATKDKFESVNEFRAQLGDQARTFLPRAEHEKEMAGQKEKVDELAKRVIAMEAKDSGANSMWVILAAILGPLVAVAIVIFTRSPGM